MKSSSTIFLQAVIVLVGIAAVALLLWEPLIEGRNAHSTLWQTYFTDPVLAYAYLASIPLFVALYQVFKLLTHVRHDTTFSPAAVKSTRTIKYCAMLIIGSVVFSIVFMPLNGGDGGDDGPQGIFMRLLVLVPTIVVAAAAAIFERLLQNAVNLKSENDLTV